MLIKLAILLLVAVSALARVFPPPTSEKYSDGELALDNVCNIYHFPSNHPLIQSGYYFNKILKRLNSNLKCSKHLTFKAKKHIKLTVEENHQLKEEAYEIIIDREGIQIIHKDYSGYVYALESLSQLIKDGKIPFVHIKDEPLLQYRGIMIDSARHFLGVEYIKRLILSMPLSKLNILHWHLVDD